MEINKGFVYIMASKRNGTLHIGVTNNLIRRVAEHISGINKGFTNRYSCQDVSILRTVFFLCNRYKKRKTAEKLETCVENSTDRTK